MNNLTHKAIWAVLVMISTGLSTVVFAAQNEPKAKETPKPPPTTTPNPLNAQIYEKDSSMIQFSDSVKVIRELDGATEVLFVKRTGVFTAPEDGSAMEKLIMSQKSGSPVAVTIDETTQKIVRVGSGVEQTPPNAKKNGR